MTERLIYANALIRSLDEKVGEGWNSSSIFINIGYIDGLADAIHAIDDQPTVDAEPVRQGKWIYSNNFHWYTASCNKCGYQRRTDIKAEGWNQWKFCPNCGAKMDERKEE